MWCRYNQGRICEGCMWCYNTQDEENKIEEEVEEEEDEEFV